MAASLSSSGHGAPGEKTWRSTVRSLCSSFGRERPLFRDEIRGTDEVGMDVRDTSSEHARVRGAMGCTRRWWADVKRGTQDRKLCSCSSYSHRRNKVEMQRDNQWKVGSE